MYTLAANELIFFDSYPDMLLIYQEAIDWLTGQYPDITVKVKKMAGRSI